MLIAQCWLVQSHVNNLKFKLDEDHYELAQFWMNYNIAIHLFLGALHFIQIGFAHVWHMPRICIRIMAIIA